MSTFDIAGGLRSPELLLLRQAVAAYVQAYTKIKEARPDKDGKASADERIAAAIAVGERLRTSTHPHTDRDAVTRVAHAAAVVAASKVLPHKLRPGMEQISVELHAALGRNPGQ